MAADGRDLFDPEPLPLCPWGAEVVLLAPSSIGLVASRSPATTSRTPYIAPRTRSASSSGSAESKVTFIAVAFQHIQQCGNPDRQRRSTLQGKRLRPVPSEVHASVGRLHRHTPPRLETLTNRRFGSRQPSSPNVHLRCEATHVEPLFARRPAGERRVAAAPVGTSNSWAMNQTNSGNVHLHACTARGRTRPTTCSGEKVWPTSGTLVPARAAADLEAKGTLVVWCRAAVEVDDPTSFLDLLRRGLQRAAILSRSVPDPWAGPADGPLRWADELARQRVRCWS